MWMTIVVVLVTFFVLVLPLLPSQYVERSAKDPTSVQILVLGDLGRSPRMQYHTQSFLRHGAQVQLIGYLGKSSSDGPRAAGPLT